MRLLFAIAYLIAGVLFIRSLGGLSRQETAPRGNLSGMVGMALAIGVTAFAWFSQGKGGLGLLLLLGMIAVGAVIGNKVDVERPYP